MDGQYIIQQARDEEEEEGPRDGELREQDRFLPIYNISKVMKKVVPQSGKVAKEARECVQECVSEFISFITRYVLRHCSNFEHYTATALHCTVNSMSMVYSS